jgi:hypothetical protein
MVATIGLHVAAQASSIPGIAMYRDGRDGRSAKSLHCRRAQAAPQSF